jgi:glycosyltransferase involved in cell wall biosynthesis
MRLAVVTSKYPAQTATFFERDMRALLEAGVEIDIFAIHPRNDALWRYSLGLTDQTRLGRDRVHHLTLTESLQRARGAWRRHRAVALRDAARAMRSAIRHGPVTAAKTAYVLPKAWAWAADHAGRYDHVLGYWGNYAGTCAYAFQRLLDPGLPFSLWLHAGVDLYRTPVFMRQKLEYADNVITCCEFNLGFILRRFGRLVPDLERKLHVCHHGLDLAEFPFRAEERMPNRVIAVGRLAAHKGFDYLLQAATIVRARGVDVTIELVGDGEERQALETLAADLGIASHVIFRGWLPFPEARAAMSRATVLVHPSDGLGDGLPNVIREAMALGTPVVASRVAGIPDALEDGCGVLVAPRDAMALADGIESVLASDGGQARIAVRARQRVEERYDVWRNGARLAELLGNTPRKWYDDDRTGSPFQGEERNVEELVEAPNDA